MLYLTSEIRFNREINAQTRSNNTTIHPGVHRKEKQISPAKKVNPVRPNIRKMSSETPNIFDPKAKTFRISGKNIDIITKPDDPRQIYFRASHLTKAMGFIDSKITKTINPENKYTMKSIIGKDKEPSEKKKAVYLDASGFLYLMQITPLEKVRMWMEHEVKPKIAEQERPAKAYDTGDIAKCQGPVFYIARIEDNTFKFGSTKNVRRRVFKEHIKTFETFEIVHLIETPYDRHIEDLLRDEIKRLKLNKKMGRLREVFMTSSEYEISYFVDFVNKMKTCFTEREETKTLEIEERKLALEERKQDLRERKEKYEARNTSNLFTI